MQTSKLTPVFFFIIGLFFLAACTSKTIQPPKTPTQPIDTTGKTDTIHFNADLLPIFTTSCAKNGCHVTGGQNPDLTAAHAYNSIVPAFVNLANPAASIIYTEVIAGGGMHSYWPSGKDQSLILFWVQQGAKNN